MHNKYELTIAHRVCPALAKTAAIYTDKFAMVKATTKSLAEALEGIRTHLIVILDGCDTTYEKVFDETFSDGKVPGVDYERISTPKVGNQATYGKQLELLETASKDSEFLYFSEDDYIYRKNAFRAMMEFLKEASVDIVTPLDHPDGYQRDREEYQKSVIRHSSICHWREIGSTCCTFMLKSSTLPRAYKSLSYYANGGADYLMGALLTKKGPFSIDAVVGGVWKYLRGGAKELDAHDSCCLMDAPWLQINHASKISHVEPDANTCCAFMCSISASVFS